MSRTGHPASVLSHSRDGATGPEPPEPVLYAATQRTGVQVRSEHGDKQIACHVLGGLPFLGLFAAAAFA